MPFDVARLQVVACGDHRDTAFQFGASVSVHFTDNRVIEFEVLFVSSYAIKTQEN
jgi:hypothetical protein